jgi:hypothetical protein
MTNWKLEVTSQKLHYGYVEEQEEISILSYITECLNIQGLFWERELDCMFNEKIFVTISTLSEMYHLCYAFRNDVTIENNIVMINEKEDYVR